MQGYTSEHKTFILQESEAFREKDTLWTTAVVLEPGEHPKIGCKGQERLP